MSLKILFVAILLSGGFFSHAQEVSGLDSAVRNLAGEKDPKTSVKLMKRIIKDYQLDKNKDSETFDIMYGTIAVNFAMQHKYKKFEKYIRLMRNKFNQTSFMNMTASNMLNENLDAAYANLVSKRTLELYDSYKEDTTAKPKNFLKEDWLRFMNFAQYPYYDTYAHSFYALGQYEAGLKYQRLAFDGPPAEGLPSSVERYAKLLELTGHKDAAKQLLLTMARRGKLNKAMTDQLQEMYIGENGTDENLGAYLDSLQKNVQVMMLPELKQKMLNETAPAFSLKDINGKTVNLSDFTGRIVVLDLWATWCSPCIASFPAMQLMVKKHPEVAFLFIVVEEKGKDPLTRVKNFIEKRNYTFTVLMDEPIATDAQQYKIISAYQPNGIPAKYIIDKKGILRFHTSGFDTDATLMNELEAMFTILQSL